MAGSYYIGIMTGTSLDAIDLAICDFSGNSVTLVAFYSRLWPERFRELLMNFATADVIDLNLLTRANFVLASEYDFAITEAIANAGLSKADIHAVGLHGQTIRHLPKPESIVGLAPVGATLQWGSGSALAAISGMDVVSDFRSADVALGGQGAPLVPMFDFAFLLSENSDRLVTNIGGISNITWLPKSSRADQVVAFDCGPGNMMLDIMTKRYFGKDFDENGDIARRGTIDEALLRTMLSEPFFKQSPPKSTGRELFGTSFLEPMNRKISSGALTRESALATLTELTARSITNSLQFVHRQSATCEIIVSGGGANNSYLMERIAANATDSSVTISDSFGIPSQAKESIAFAYFAKARIDETFIHLPHTTGASRRAILGSVSRGS